MISQLGELSTLPVFDFPDDFSPSPESEPYKIKNIRYIVSPGRKFVTAWCWGDRKWIWASSGRLKFLSNQLSNK
jgi:hypothetical protein